MTNMKLLTTGFGEFPGVPINLTGDLVAEWRENQPNWPFSAMYFEVLPTSYEHAGARVARLIQDLDPDHVLMLGIGGVRGTIQLERFAVNIDDSILADVFGEVRQGLPIASDCPAALMTRTDLVRLRDLLVSKGTLAEISNHAGSYVCNHAYFVALREAALAKKLTRVLFAHLPGGYEIALPEQRGTLTARARQAIAELAHQLAVVDRP